MRVVVVSSADRAARVAARSVAAALRRDPALVLGLPTGRTPVLFYETLVALYRRRRVDFGLATTFNLDELIGLARDDPRSYRAYMRRHLFEHVNLAPRRTHLPDSAAVDGRLECARYERQLTRAGGLGLAVVGLGRNGHVGFNEPAPALQGRTHVTRLRLESRRANAHLFGGRWQQVPTHAISMGIGTILQARAILLIATGRTKARVLASALQGPVTTRVPASLLQTHPSALAIVDADAARYLRP